MSSSSDQADKLPSIETMVKKNPYYKTDNLRVLKSQLENYKSIISNIDVETSKKELDVYKTACIEGKVRDNKSRQIMWLELLGVKRLDCKSFIDAEWRCK